MVEEVEEWPGRNPYQYTGFLPKAYPPPTMLHCVSDKLLTACHGQVQGFLYSSTLSWTLYPDHSKWSNRLVESQSLRRNPCLTGHNHLPTLEGLISNFVTGNERSVGQGDW